MNVLDLTRRHGLEPKKQSSTKGGEYACGCPSCGGKDRFRLWPEQNQGEGSYWCRRCGKGGDAIQFLRDFDGLTFRQACERLGRPLPDSRDLRTPTRPKDKVDGWTPREPQDPEATWSEHATKLAMWAFDQLMGNDEQLGWLAARGIGLEAAMRFSLGWMPRTVFRARESWGLAPVVSEKTGKARPLGFPAGIVIPWLDGERVVKLRIRRSGELKGWPRYHMVPGSASVTTLVRPARKESIVREAYVIVESELDAYLVAAQAGDLVGAVALGSANAHPDAAAARTLAGAACILNALDADEAGAKERAWWETHYPRSKRWPVPEGKDPGEAFAAGVNLRSWILAGLPPGLK